MNMDEFSGKNKNKDLKPINIYMSKQGGKKQ